LYKDEQAAIKKRGKADKHPLTSSPFILEAEGYWTYDSMVLQLEDCADVVTTLHPHYQFFSSLTIPVAMTELERMH
jgi:hypothetical protein